MEQSRILLTHGVLWRKSSPSNAPYPNIFNQRPFNLTTIPNSLAKWTIKGLPIIHYLNRMALGIAILISIQFGVTLIHLL